MRVGLAQRTDWPAVRRLVPAVYRAVGQAPPESVITLHSPRAGLVAAATRTATSKSKPYDVREQVDHRARWQVSSEVRSHVRAQVWTSVREEVEEQIRRQVSDQIRAELRDQFPHLISNIWGVALGLHDAPWLAYYDFSHVSASIRLRWGDRSSILPAPGPAGGGRSGRLRLSHPRPTS